MALPAHVDRVVLTERPGERSGRLVARVVPGATGSVDAEVVDGDGRVFVRLEGYRTIAMPGGVDEALLAPLRTLPAAT